jgi:hypothetical protein
MLLRPHVILLLLFAPLLTSAQYSGPESVEYDPVGDRYFVSNTTGLAIKVRDQAGTVTDFVTGMAAAPYGLEILGDVLYACTGGGVRGYSLATGQQVFQIALNAGFANGITTDGTYLYVTDFNNSTGRKIFKVDPVAGTFTTLVQNLPGQPNGIVHLPGTNEVLVAFWGSNAAVRSYDTTTGANTGNVTTTVGNIDGIAIDCEGKVLIASWSPARISRFTWGIPSPTLTNLNVPGLNNPADIDYDTVHDRVCIPNSGNNTVTFFDLACTTGVPELSQSTVLIASPNPARDMLAIEPAFPTAEGYVLMDARGLVLGGGTLSPRAKLDVSGLKPGAYTLFFSRGGQRVRFIKE